jgi:predicted metal-binding protein
MSETNVEFDSPKWDAAMLICKECGKRKNGPRDLKAKALVKRARGHLKEARPRPRVMSTSCMGICPKHAIAVAWVGCGTAPRILCVGDQEGFDESVPRLMERST